MIDPNEIHERLRISGEEWAELDAAANLLEETKKPLRAKLMNESGAPTMAKAEVIAESSDTYLEHVESMVEARKQATIARVRYDSAKMWAELVRSQEATNRAQMRV